MPEAVLSRASVHSAITLGCSHRVPLTYKASSYRPCADPDGLLLEIRMRIDTEIEIKVDIEMERDSDGDGDPDRSGDRDRGVGQGGT